MASTAMTFKLFGHDASASKTFREVGKTAAGVASGMGAAFAASKVKDWAKDSLTAFDNAGKASLKLQRYMGGSIEDASRLGHAFRMSGIDVDQAGKGLGILSKHLAAGDDAAKSLGISFQDSTGKVKPMGELLPQIADKFKNMPAGAERTALAMSLFGRSGADLLPFLSKGSEGIQELMKQSDALGTTMSGKDGQAVKDYTKTQREFKEMIYGVQISLGRALYPTLTHLGTTLLPMLLPKVHEFTKQLAKAPQVIDEKWPKIKEQIEKVGGYIDHVQKVVKDNWPAVKDTFSRVGDALQRVGQWTRYLWDRFQSLPGPVKELIAMLAIAQKTGVLSIAFKGLDLAKNLIARIAGMSVQAGVVNVNGGAGSLGGIGGKGGSLLASALTITAVGAVTVMATAALIGDPESPWGTKDPKKPNEVVVPGISGIATPDQLSHAKELDDAFKGVNLSAYYAAQNIDKVRTAVGSAATAMGILSGGLHDASGKAVKAGGSFNATADGAAGAASRAFDLLGKLRLIPANKETKIFMNTTAASVSILDVAGKIKSLLNPQPIRLTATADAVHRAIGPVIGSLSALVHPPPIRIDADASRAMQVINAVAGAMSSINSAIGVLASRGVRRVVVRRVPRMATGGIVTGPTLGIVGEAGPEAVIPLSRARGLGVGNTEVHVHVSGSVFATKEQMAREVVAALQNAKNRGLQLGLA